MGAVPWRVVRYEGGIFSAVDDVVVDEVPLTLYVNGEQVVTVLTLGDEPLELAVGFLRAEGFLDRREELLGWEVAPDAVRVRVARDLTVIRKLFEKRTVTTGCGKGTSFYQALDALRLRPVTSSPEFSAPLLLERMRELNERSELYHRTGGTHNASLIDLEKTLLFRTDIGRHNAVDMIGGRAFLDGMVLAGTALLTSGRVSSEILGKVAKMEVPVLVSRSAPTALALRLAEELGVTVVGYARGNRLSVYTHPRRIRAAKIDEETGEGHG
jgi:FdhD protein